MRLFLWLFFSGTVVYGQEFRILNRTVQFHLFASQGFIHTDQNNWLTMRTAHIGSGEFTDFAVNATIQISDNFRVGAQIYDRNLGALGKWYPSLDWAVADYRWRNWLGFRGGKVKTVVGLYSDTQDFDFVHPFALLPQSVYPTDLRDSTIAHKGGDVYGQILLPPRFGDLSYTAFAGHRNDSLRSGYAYLLTAWQADIHSLSGLQYGADVRWKTPLKGLLVGASRMNEELTADMVLKLFDPQGVHVVDSTKSDWTNDFYGQYAKGKLNVDAEYRRYVRDTPYLDGHLLNDVRGWYVAGAYRLSNHLQIGSYYSRYNVTAVASGSVALLFPPQVDPSLPQNHVYDKVVTGRIDLNRHWNIKVEAHYMDGYGLATYPDGFYPQVNPNGFKSSTNALIAKTSVTF